MTKKILMVLCVVVCIAGFIPCQSNAGDVYEPAKFPSLFSSIRIKPPVNFCGEPVPLDNQEVYERLEKELLILLWDRAQVVLWIKRTGRYFPYIEKALKQNNMPDDLKYSAVIESSLLPHIGSSKYAVGYWQFLRSTGQRYGLDINSEIDERRNIHTSTMGAIKYLKKLYGDFGSWTLAVAAYNMGETGLKNRIEFQKTNDFYNLYLPMETQRHLLKIVAAKLILSNPQKYGFNFTEKDLYKPRAFDRVEVNCKGKTSLQIVAEAANTYFKTIKDLNPELRGYSLNRGLHSIAIPKGASRGFHARYKKLAVKEAVAKKVEKKKKSPRRHVYVVKRGDYLSRIADRFNVSLSSLVRWNSLNPKKPLLPGKRLIIYRD